MAGISRFCDDLYVYSRYFQKICQHRGKAGGVSKTLLTTVKSHIATENNMVVTCDIIIAVNLMA